MCARFMFVAACDNIFGKKCRALPVKSDAEMDAALDELSCVHLGS